MHKDHRVAKKSRGCFQRIKKYSHGWAANSLTFEPPFHFSFAFNCLQLHSKHKPLFFILQMRNSEFFNVAHQMSSQRYKFNAEFTCKGHLVCRCSAAVDSYAVNPPSAGRSRRAQCFSFSSHHKGCWCRGRTEQAGCIPLAPAPGSDGESGDTFAGCTGWSQAPSWCRPQRILTAENHTSHKVHSPVLPSGTDFLHSAAWEMKLEGWNNGAKPDG